MRASAIWRVLNAVLFYALMGSGAVTTGQPTTHDSFKFTSVVYNATVYERTLVGKTYIVPDQRMGIQLTGDKNLVIEYGIEGEDYGRLFRVDDKVVGDFCFMFIRTRTSSSQAEVINRESRKSYTLKIKAIGRTAGATLQSYTTVQVTVLDINDLSPIFEETEYSTSVGEDAPLFSTVTRVSASDADIGINAEIYYSFRQASDTFAIHPTSGDVFTTRRLDTRKQNVYVLDILAKDRGAKSKSSAISDSTVQLTIRLTQENFFAPKIRTQRQNTIIENGVAGTVYAILTVTDDDSSGSNGAIGAVTIVNGDPRGYFSIHKTTNRDEYAVEVEHGLDRELSPDGYNLIITATDKGYPQKSTTTKIHVDVLDSNDNPPVFDQSEYTIKVNETVPVGTPVMFIRAKDRDFGKNAELHYSIEKGNHHGWFDIHSDTGLILTAALLDAEQYKQVDLIVGATDQSNIGARRQGTATVRVRIIDCNDNAPVLKFDASTPVHVKENLPPGSNVTAVRADDADEGDNSYISYSIANVNPVPFTIDHFTGIVYTKAVLDYESMKHAYKLKIRASDWGQPYRRESERVLTVELQNVNDNRPQFERINCTGYLSRSAPAGTELVTVSAIDYDIGSNIITYEIIHVSEDRQECFELNTSSGKLRLSGRCDIKNPKIKHLSIKIVAFDGHNQSEPTTVNVTLVRSKQNTKSGGHANIHCRATKVRDKLHELIAKQTEAKKKKVPTATLR